MKKYLLLIFVILWSLVGLGAPVWATEVGNHPPVDPFADLPKIYVSASAGKDTNSGTKKDQPFATISKGIAEAMKNNKPTLVEITAGVYDEAVDVKPNIHLRGSYEKDFSKFTVISAKDRKSKLRKASDYAAYTVITNSKGNTVITANNITSNTTLNNLVVIGTDLDTRTDGTSSYAIKVDNSTTQATPFLTLDTVKVVAGNGAKGKPGASRTTPFASQHPTKGGAGGKSEKQGRDDDMKAGMWHCISFGGTAAPDFVVGGSVLAKGGAGGPAGGYEECYQRSGATGSAGGGNPGAPGASPTQAAAGGKANPDTAGMFNAALIWAGAEGAEGETGIPGAGGGGGGAGGSTIINWFFCKSSILLGGWGGDGGRGGAGGLGGLGGNPGGSSFGLVVHNAKVNVSNVAIHLGDGGQGGNGANGEAGFDGEAGKPGAPGKQDKCLEDSRHSGDGKEGGKGGKGADGGGGAGGNGGVSVGIACLTKDCYKATGDLELMGGKGGKGGDPGTGGKGAEVGKTGLTAETKTYTVPSGIAGASWVSESGNVIDTGWGYATDAFSTGKGVIYTVNSSGYLRWFKNTTNNGTSGWAAGHASIVGSDWTQFKSLVADISGNGVIYAIAKNAPGTLAIYKGSDQSGPLSSVTSTVIPDTSGWQTFKSVFSGGNGILYAITEDGKLLWYKDTKQDGTASFAPGSGNAIGAGWARFKQVLADERGNIYAIEPDGTLKWYFDPTRDGTTWGMGGDVIESDWLKNAKHIFSGGDGVVYAINDKGELLWNRFAIDNK
nr:MAG: hypothetical protein EDM05_33500 [Leptolyngbya sp. IPPAS B-1204]